MDDLFGLIVIIIGIAAGIYSDKKKKEGKQKKAAVPNQPGGGRKNVPQTQVSYGGHAGSPHFQFPLNIGWTFLLFQLILHKSIFARVGRS